jgi:hypothetical protein
MKLTYTTLILVTLLGCSGVAVGQQNGEILGSYLFRFEWGGARLTLKANGMFQRESGSCTHLTTESGPYRVKDGVLYFTTTKMTTNAYGEKKKHDLTKMKNRRKFLETEEPFKPFTATLKVFRWGQRTYLLDEDQFTHFVRAINLGFEPRAVDGYRAYFPFFLKEGDENLPVDGPPPVPKEFLSNLLPAPITAIVTHIELAGNRKLVTIDRGSEDGLRVGLPLVVVSPEPYYFDHLEIVSVEARTARVEVYRDIKVGDQLSTRVADASRFY